MNDEQLKLRRYFLGRTTDEETEEIDLRIIEDEDFVGDVSLAENDLIEDFIDHELSGEEVRDFNLNFLMTPEREEHVREIYALKKYASRLRREGQRADEPSVIKPRSYFGTFFRPAFVGLAVAAVALVAVVIWQGFFVQRASQLEREYAELNKRDLTDLTMVGDNATFNLTSGNLRDSGSIVSKRGGDLTDKVLFRLALPTGDAEGKGFSVTLLKGSTPVFSLGDIRGYQNQSGREVRFVLPKSILTSGQYQIRLDSPDGKSRAVIYPFTIE